MRSSTCTAVFLLSLLSASTLAHRPKLQARQATLSNAPYPAGPKNATAASNAAPSAIFTPSLAMPTGAAALTITTFTSPHCDAGSISLTQDVVYGQNYQAQAISYNLSRPLTVTEQLDFSMGVAPGQAMPSGFGANPGCAHFLYTASASGSGLLQATCYDILTPSGIPGCFRLWWNSRLAH